MGLEARLGFINHPKTRNDGKRDIEFCVGVSNNYDEYWNESSVVDGAYAGICNVFAVPSRGVLAGGFNLARDHAGVQAGIIAISGDVTGAQIGAFSAADVCGAHVGVYTLSDETHGVTVAGYSSAENHEGFRLAAIGKSEFSDGVDLSVLCGVTEHGTGVRGSLFDVVKKRFDGVQFAGLVAYAKDGNYLQFAPITVHGDGPWYKRISPFVGFHKRSMPSED